MIMTEEILTIRKQVHKSMEDIYKVLDKNDIFYASYDSLVDLRWTEECKFCNCGQPEEAQQYIKEVLSAIKLRSDSEWEINNVSKVIKSNPDSFEYFLLYVLEAMDLTEHGGSVGGSWLTEEGMKLLDEMQETFK